jgi:hypothetical protein
MTAEADVRAAERAFFSSLLQPDHDALARLLGEDFLLIDVVSGCVRGCGRRLAAGERPRDADCGGGQRLARLKSVAARLARP